MRHLKLIAVALVVIGLPLVAQTNSWRIGIDEPFPNHLTDLPRGRQRSILDQLKPSFDKWFKDAKPGELEAAEKSLLIREVATPSGPLLFVQGWEVSLCGAVGNCVVWELDQRDQVIFSGQGERMTILQAMSHGRPSILIAYHDSASEADLSWYRFDGVKYRRTRCATESSGTPWKAYDHPLIENHPCGK